MPTEFPNGDTYYYIFCPHMNKDALFSAKVAAETFVVPLRIVFSQIYT